LFLTHTVYVLFLPLLLLDCVMSTFGDNISSLTSECMAHVIYVRVVTEALNKITLSHKTSGGSVGSGAERKNTKSVNPYGTHTATDHKYVSL